MFSGLSRDFTEHDHAHCCSAPCVEERALARPENRFLRLITENFRSHGMQITRRLCGEQHFACFTTIF